MSSIFNYFKWFMALIYIAIGLWLFMNPAEKGSFLDLDPALARIIAVLLILYGSFRAYTQYIQQKREEEE